MHETAIVHLHILQVTVRLRTGLTAAENGRLTAMAFWVGTSGYNYPEWKGSFYPEKIQAAKMLPYYAERFPTVEINYTFYRMPNEDGGEVGAGDAAFLQADAQSPASYYPRQSAEEHRFVRGALLPGCRHIGGQARRAPFSAAA